MTDPSLLLAAEIAGVIIAALVIGFVVGRWSCRVVIISFKNQLWDAREDNTQLRQAFEQQNRRFYQMTHATMAHLGANMGDDGNGRCQTRDRSPKAVAELLARERTVKKNEEQWNRVYDNQDVAESQEEVEEEE